MFSPRAKDGTFLNKTQAKETQEREGGTDPRHLEHVRASSSPRLYCQYLVNPQRIKHNHPQEHQDTSDVFARKLHHLEGTQVII